MTRWFKGYTKSMIVFHPSTTVNLFCMGYCRLQSSVFLLKCVSLSLSLSPLSLSLVVARLQSHWCRLVSVQPLEWMLLLAFRAGEFVESSGTVFQERNGSLYSSWYEESNKNLRPTYTQPVKKCFGIFILPEASRNKFWIHIAICLASVYAVSCTSFALVWSSSILSSAASTCASYVPCENIGFFFSYDSNLCLLYPAWYNDWIIQTF